MTGAVPCRNTARIRKKEYGIHMDLSIIGIAGTLISFTRLRKPVYRELDRTETETLQTGLNGGNKDE